MLRMFAYSMLFILALGARSEAEERFLGFNIGGEVINPMCLQKMRPWYSDGAIIIKSIVLENCQNSNWAYAVNPIVVDGNLVSTKVEGAVASEVESEVFSYEVAGRTDSGVFVLMLSDNWVAAYRIDEQVVKDELFKPQTSRVHVLTALGESWVPCLQKVAVKGNKVVIEKQIYHQDAARPDQCDTKMEMVEYDIGG
jgi:hypothetical protein